MANPEGDRLVVDLAGEDSDDDDDDDDNAAGPPPGQPRRDRLERIALFDFLRLVAGNREPQPGFRTNADLVQHLKRNDTLTSDAVARAMMACPRDVFVPPPHHHEALVDRPIRVEAAGFNISAPHVQVVALQALALEPGQRVLDVGCGCGIVTAYAAYLTGSSGEVVGVDIRDSAIALATSNLDRLRAQNVEFSEMAAPIRLERHNVFIPLARHQGRYDAVHVGGAMQESRLGAILDLLGPRGGRIVAPIANELRLVTKLPDGAVRQRVMSQVSFSELEVPRDVVVVRALLQDQTELARRVEVPPSTFASDLGHLAAPGADLQELAAAAAAAAAAGAAPASGTTAAAAAPPSAPESPRRCANGVRPRSVTSLTADHMTAATLPPARRTSGRDGTAADNPTAHTHPDAHTHTHIGAGAGKGGQAGAPAGAGGASPGLGGWGWRWETAEPAAVVRDVKAVPAAGMDLEAGEAGAGAGAEAGEKEALLGASRRAEEEEMEAGAAAPAGPVEAEAAGAESAEDVGGRELDGFGPDGSGGGADNDVPGYLADVDSVLALGPPDCELTGDGWRLPAHKPVLQARCDLLRAHMSSGMRDSDATRYPVPEAVERREAVEAFLHYVYKDRLPPDVDSELMPQLLHAGIYFGCHRLVQLCEALLAQELVAASGPTGQSGADTEVLAAAVAAAAPLLALADEGGLDQLRRVAMQFVLDHFPAVSASEGYRQLPRPLVDAVAAEAIIRYEGLLRHLDRLGAQPAPPEDLDD